MFQVLACLELANSKLNHACPCRVIGKMSPVCVQKYTNVQKQIASIATCQPTVTSRGIECQHTGHVQSKFYGIAPS